MYISEDIRYIGVNDHKIDLFEGQYSVPNGMSYNSYIIIDEKIAVMDTVDTHFSDVWLDNLADALEGRKPDFLVVQHMEPDHSGSILEFVKVYPHTKIVASAKAFVMMKQFFGTNFADRQIIAGLETSIELGRHTLSFVPAPMVHWPEVIVTYDNVDKILFSADGFGKFGALDREESWEDEARRYYFGIVGKYGVQVQALLKKVAAFDIEKICPLHGPVLMGEQMLESLKLYDIWSRYEAEDEGIFIAYTSIYGHTKESAEKLYEKLKSLGKSNVIIADLAREDISKCVGEAFRYKKLVLASPTYNGDIFPYMRSFIEHLTERNYQNRTVAFIENGSWAPAAANVMRKMLEKSKNLSLVEPTITIKGCCDEGIDEFMEKLIEQLQ